MDRNGQRVYTEMDIEIHVDKTKRERGGEKRGGGSYTRGERENGRDRGKERERYRQF